MLRKRRFTVKKFVVLEPGALDYSCNVETCVYRGGRVDPAKHPDLEGKVVVVSAGGEHLDLFPNVFDTIMVSWHSTSSASFPFRSFLFLKLPTTSRLSPNTTYVITNSS
jgi:hypothetical protein